MFEQCFFLDYVFGLMFLTFRLWDLGGYGREIMWVNGKRAIEEDGFMQCRILGSGFIF